MEPKLIKTEPKWNQNTKLDSISSANEVPHSYHLTNRGLAGSNRKNRGLWTGEGEGLRPFSRMRKSRIKSRTPEQEPRF